jgi:uncharacterized membrane protein YhaH (DUF805 family)
MIDDDSLKNLEKLHQLKTDGVITEADFESAKQKLLQGQSKVQATSAAAPVSLGESDWFGWAILPLKRYADFTGRARRKEYWLFGLFIVAVMLVACIVTAPMGETAMGVVVLLVALGSIVPTVAVTVRRFHDQDKSGWFALLSLVPYVGWLIVAVFMLIDGTPGDNRFGPSPKQT